MKHKIIELLEKHQIPYYKDKGDSSHYIRLKTNILTRIPLVELVSAGIDHIMTRTHADRTEIIIAF